jgi:hypothetical protein
MTLVVDGFLAVIRRQRHGEKKNSRKWRTKDKGRGILGGKNKEQSSISHFVRLSFVLITLIQLLNYSLYEIMSKEVFLTL